MKKLSFLLAILMLMQCFLLVACNKDAKKDEDPEQPPVDTNAKIAVADIQNYKIICALRTPTNVSGQCWQLYEYIKTTYSVEIIPENDGVDVTDFEILVGNTNREETKTFLANLLWDDYGYAIVGNKIVIAGHTDEGTYQAMKSFIEQVKKAEAPDVFFSNKNQFLYRYPYASTTFMINGVDAAQAKLVVNANGGDKQIAQAISDKALEICGIRPEIVTDADVKAGDTMIIIGASQYVPAAMQAEWESAQTTVEGQFSYYINSTDKMVWINTSVMEGYAAINRTVLPLIQSSQTGSVVLATGLVKVPQIFSVMSFNIFVSQFNTARTQRVVDTILENAPSVFGVQEASTSWMSALRSKLGDVYASVGVGRDRGGAGEHSAIFYRTDKFELIEGGTRWLSATPETEASYYTYTDAETGVTHRANFPRIMTYAVLERKNDGVRFLYVNTHLDHNGNNSQEVAEKVRQGQIEVLIAQIAQINSNYGNLPTMVTGDFNVTPVASAYTTMIGAGYLDASKVAKEGEIKPTYNDMNDNYEGAIIDYIFVSPELAELVDTYTVCPSKRDGQWISDHNAIIASITLPKSENP